MILYPNHIFKKIKNHKFIFVIPFFFTFANALFGFLSIIKSFEGDFYSASLLIGLAVISDGLDGRLARFFQTSGLLGSELDSLCDAISFCLAPAILLYSWYLKYFNHANIFIMVLAIYIFSGLFRLARFNCNNFNDSLFFFGLPTTISAFLISMLIFYKEWVLKSSFNFLFKESIVVAIIIFISFLMISSLKFPSFKKKRKKKIKKSLTIIKLLLYFFAISWAVKKGYPLFLLIVSAYIFGSIFLNFLIKFKNIDPNENQS